MLDRIKEIICNFAEIDPEDITLDSKLLGDLGLSSFDLAMVSSDIENEFGVEISPKVFATVKTVGGIIDYIENNR